MLEETWEIMDLLGLERDRLYLKWISASEGAIFAAEIRNFVERIRQMGMKNLKVLTPAKTEICTPPNPME